jgi:hypothetical protein
MAGALDKMRARYELKMFPINDTVLQEAHGGQEDEEKEECLCVHVVVHVFVDSTFAKYEAYRAANRQHPLPPLLRGQSWWLRFVSRESLALVCLVSTQTHTHTHTHIHTHTYKHVGIIYV